MGTFATNAAGNRQHQPSPHPGRDFPPPPIEDPPDDGEPGQPPVRDPPVHPDGDLPMIA